MLHKIYADAKRTGLTRFQQADQAKLAEHYGIPIEWAAFWKPVVVEMLRR